MSKPTHGRSEYRRGCRCDTCTAGNTVHVGQQRRRRLVTAELAHGKRSGYDAGCRCDECREVRRDAYVRLEGGHKPHWWRDLVTSVYRDQWDAWEALRESGSIIPPGAVAGASGAAISAYQLEDADFRAAYPPPTLGAVLTGLAGQQFATGAVA